MGKALYRKYRSSSLDEIVGQPHVTDILRRALKQGKISHAYLFTGPRGVGKTSIARILAHEINKLPYDETTQQLDIIEIDAASRSGVDDIRELRDKVQIAPVSADKKIYIIDEVHMLSKAAFNALLKTLEEPPEHVVFILATTDADKLPQTIISRTQQFGFRMIAADEVAAHLAVIAKKEKIKVDDAALVLIAEQGGGSFRDSIGMLDQLSSLADVKSGITTELVEQSLGLAPLALVQTLVSAYDERDLNAIVNGLHIAEQQGIQTSTLVHQLVARIRSDIVEHPERITLLDGLIEVSGSTHPAVKLLTTLAAHAVPVAKPKTAALVATPATKKSTETLIPALEQAATEPEPSEATVRQTAEASIHSDPITLDWQALIDHTKAHMVALYSVLQKCSAETHDSDITLYCRNGFYKKKLDDPKYMSQLHQALEAIGTTGATITTIPSTAPPKDSKLASIAAMMGGGEEVSLTDS